MDIKFSDFTNITVPSGTEQIVGYAGATNIRMDIDTIKDYIDSAKGYKEIFAEVNTASSTVDVFKNDFPGLTFTYSNPSNAIVRITSPSPIFVAGKTKVLASNANGGGVPYIVTGSAPSTSFVSLTLFKFDGTTTATPNIITLVEIRVYP